jgi:hypothetical protein
MCGECGRPKKGWGYIVAVVSFIATTLLLPILIVYATWWLNDEQQRIANRQKLADAYVAFGSTMTEFRRAAATFDVLKSITANDRIDLADVKKAMLDFDAAFNAIGAKLGPFQEAAFRGNQSSLAAYLSAHPRSATVANEIALTWNSCFVAPYYGTSAVPYEKTYWFKIHDLLKACSGKTCPRQVAKRISDVIGEIWSGTCVCERPQRQRPMNWLYPVIQGLMQETDVSGIATPPGEVLATKSNSDLSTANNPYCKATNQTTSP